MTQDAAIAESLNMGKMAIDNGQSGYPCPSCVWNLDIKATSFRGNELTYSDSVTVAQWHLIMASQICLILGHHRFRKLPSQQTDGQTLLLISDWMTIKSLDQLLSVLMPFCTCRPNFTCTPEHTQHAQDIHHCGREDTSRGLDPLSGLILGLRPANERWHYFVTTSLIGWVQS